GRAFRNHLGEWCIRARPSTDSQLVAHEFAFELHFSLSVSVRHSCNKRESLGPTGAFFNGVKKLCRADRPGDLSGFVFEIEIAGTHSAFGRVDVVCDPVAVEIARRLLSARYEKGNGKER